MALVLVILMIYKQYYNEIGHIVKSHHETRREKLPELQMAQQGRKKNQSKKRPKTPKTDASETRKLETKQQKIDKAKAHREKMNALNKNVMKTHLKANFKKQNDDCNAFNQTECAEQERCSYCTSPFEKLTKCWSKAVALRSKKDLTCDKVSEKDRSQYRAEEESNKICRQLRTVDACATEHFCVWNKDKCMFKLWHERTQAKFKKAFEKKAKKEKAQKKRKNAKRRLSRPLKTVSKASGPENFGYKHGGKRQGRNQRPQKKSMKLAWMAAKLLGFFLLPLHLWYLDKLAKSQKKLANLEDKS